MPLPDDVLKEWFAARLKEHTLLRYHAQLQNRVPPRTPDLGTSVTPANPEMWPRQARGAHQFYVLHLVETGKGNVSAYSAFIDDTFVMVVRARTQSDDGAIEVYDEHGLLLAAARSYIEVLAWGNLDWLRAQFKDEPVLPPELADGKDRTLWGSPIEGYHCCEAREHRCKDSPPGRCNGAPGHLALGTPHRCFRCGFKWGLPEAEEEAIELAEDWTPEPESEIEEAIELPEDPAPQTEAEEAIEIAEDWTPEQETETEEALELSGEWTPESQFEEEEAIELPADWPPPPLLPDDPVQAWYTKRLHDFYFDRYLALRGYTITGKPRKDNSEEDVYPRDDELSPNAVRVELEALPDAARTAYDFYHKNFAEADIGSTRCFQVPTDSGITLAIRTTTDGDDGYLEVFSTDGEFLGAARTELNVIAWGSQDWLRAQVANHGEFTPEMLEAKKRSFWGMPLPWDCQSVCWQCQATGITGVCICKKGHRQRAGDPHRCNSGHAWDDTPPDPRLFVRPRFELSLRDGRSFVGVLHDFKMTFDTRFGPLTVFAADIKRIDFALTNSHDTTSAISTAVRRLGGADAKEAEEELLVLGARAFPAMVALAQCGNEPIHRRARGLAGRIRASTTPEQLSLRTSHQVTTPDATFAANFPPDTFGFGLITDAGHQSFDNHELFTLRQVPGPTIEVPRPNPRWLGRFYTNSYGAKLSFIVTGDPNDGDVMGSNPYTLDSMLASAAVHAGVVKPGETKIVRVEIILAPSTFVGSGRNGVTSIDWEEPETVAFRILESQN